MEALFLKLYEISTDTFSKDPVQLNSCGDLTLPELAATHWWAGGSPRCTQLKFIHLSEGKADMNLALKGIILSWDPASSILGLRKIILKK